MWHFELVREFGKPCTDFHEVLRLVKMRDDVRLKEIKEYPKGNTCVLECEKDAVEIRM